MAQARRGGAAAAKRCGRRGGVEDVQADVARACERNERYARIAHERCADGLARRGAEVQDIAGQRPLDAALFHGLHDDVEHDPGDTGRLLRGLDDDGVARDECGDGHAAADGEGEVPGRDDDGDAARLVPLLIELADEPAQALALKEGHGAAGVEVAEVDGFADVGVCLAPGLAGFLDHDAGEAVALLTHEGGGAEKDLGALARVDIAPLAEGGTGALHHLAGLLDGPVVGDLGDGRACDGGGEGLSLLLLREVAHRLGEEGARVREAGRCRAQAVPLGERFGGEAFRARIVARARAGRAEEGAGVGVVEEAGLEPALVAGVLEQTPHEVGHAGDHLAHGYVLTHAQAELRRGVLELVRHAVEHLELDGAPGEATLIAHCEGRRDRAGVVRAERELHAPHSALALLTRRGVEEDRRHLLKARVGLPLAGPDGACPAVHLGLDRLGIPVRTLHEAHRHLLARALGPLADAACVLGAAAQVGLHREPGLEVDLLHAAHEELDGQVLEGVVLHVEVHENALVARGLEKGDEAAHEVRDRALGVDGVHAGREGADLDRDVGARDGAEVILLEAGLRGPGRDCGGEILNEVEVLALVLVGLFVTHAGLTEEIDAEGDAVAPQLLEAGQCAGGVGAGDELAGHARNLARDLACGEALGELAGLDGGVDHAGHGDAGLAEVIGEVIEDILGRAEHREAVDEAEELDLEDGVLHGPLHQRIVVELRGEEAALVATCAGEEVGADLEDARLELRPAAAATAAHPAPASTPPTPGLDRDRLRDGLGLAGEKRHGLCTPFRS